MENIVAPAPLISIVICTYNNAESLAVTLQQIISQDIPQSITIELIVIDNNSSHHTASILQSIRTDKFIYRYYFEPRQGVSHARNTGFKNAQGAYILYTDDDADIPPLWLKRYLQKIVTTNADCIFGKIIVLWEKPSPWWYDKEKYQGFFAALDYGDEKLHIQNKSKPFLTKNACIKKIALLKLEALILTLEERAAH